ncbi:ankyrin repeat domain-containing protein [Rickettsiales endosymbiont of Peranema trichophorum]|uniref:ankyrin repeat domain-containing protein n=1 Tax=Rickettsiales endosymbiont of Peranema trichophorum TaxID=2486577 RepID=UPI0013EE7CAB|nr:ankyrin repeat domain-containing protein [Rickettsiales endosymbiont of Peranema trichophorum]
MREVDYQLCAACTRGDILEVKKAVLMGANVNCLLGEPIINTIRGTASGQDKKEIIKYLLGQGANLNIGDGIVLTWAVRANDTILVEWLVNTLNMRGIQDDGFPVLDAINHPDILEILLKGGVKVSEEIKEIIYDMDFMHDQTSAIKCMIDDYLLHHN